GPWTGALLAGALLLKRWVDDQMRAQRAADLLSTELDGQVVSMHNLNDEMLLSHLRSEGVLGAFLDLGLSLDTVKEAIAGNSDAVAEVEDTLGEAYGSIPFGSIERWKNLTHEVTGGLVGQGSEV